MIKEVNAKVEQVTPLSDSIIKIILAPETYIDYQAGQYLQICEGKNSLYYSIANAPLGSHTYELHIRHEAENPITQGLLTLIKDKGYLKIRVPLGDCHLNKLSSAKPILFIAGGTGFAPIKAMIEQLLANGDKRPFALYWSARTQSDLYMDEKLRLWKANVEQFSYESLIANRDEKDKLAKLIFSNFKKTLHSYQIVLAGSYDMVYAIRDILVQEGLDQTDLYSDAFSTEA